MTKIEALELELAARKLVEGTGLGWVEVLRTKDTHRPACNKLTWFNWDNTELALGIIEGKPVWNGSDAYWTDLRGNVNKLTVSPGCDLTISGWSWNQPSPKTVLVELLVVDAEYYANETEISIARVLEMLGRRAIACRKALEGLK